MFLFAVSEMIEIVYLPYLTITLSVKTACCNKAILQERERVGGSHGHHVSELLHLHYCSPFHRVSYYISNGKNLYSFLLFQ